MTGQYILDFSYAHADITPAKVDDLGAYGCIAYAGCDNTRKNITPAEFAALVKAKIPVALVIENLADDALKGRATGVALGRALVAAAKVLGYDVANCVLFWGYDSDSHPADLPAIEAAMEGFASEVPVPGYYGDSDSIDFLHAKHPRWVFWQSDSTSFSPKNPTPNAHLLQKFNDPRAKGAQVDVNDVYRTPLRFHGEPPQFEDGTMADGLSPTAQDQIRAIVRGELNKGVPGPGGRLRRVWRVAANALHPGKAVRPGSKKP